jgi:hypothetical protein
VREDQQDHPLLTETEIHRRKLKLQYQLQGENSPELPHHHLKDPYEALHLLLDQNLLL